MIDIKENLEVGDNISFYKLKIFCKVAEKKSVTLAANELYISQPAVSNHIKDLEELFGFKLFERKKGNFLLTKAGNELYYFSRNTLISWKKTIKSYKTGINETITIAVAMSVSIEKFSKVLYQFREIYPSVDITIIVAPTSEIYELILSNQVDIGITIFSSTLHKHIISLNGWEEELIFVAAPDFPIFVNISRKKRKINSSELNDQPFVCAIQGSSYSKLMDAKLKEIGIESFKCAGQINDINAMKCAVAAGFGISLFFKNSVKYELDNSMLKQLNINHTSLMGKFSIVYKNNKSLNKIHFHFVDYIKRNLP